MMWKSMKDIRKWTKQHDVKRLWPYNSDKSIANAESGNNVFFDRVGSKDIITIF